MIDVIKSLLKTANKIFESSISYYTKEYDETIEINATKETEDVLSTLNPNAQSFRICGFSVDASALKVDNTTFKPSRGDVITTSEGIYKVVESGGVGWIPRFSIDADRILIYAEREGDAEDSD